MATSAQIRASRNYRKNLRERGLKNISVRGRIKDEHLIKAFANKLSQDDETANDLRALVKSKIDERQAFPAIGGIVTLLQNAPKSFEDLDLSRNNTELRDIDFD